MINISLYSKTQNQFPNIDGLVGDYTDSNIGSASLSLSQPFSLIFCFTPNSYTSNAQYISLNASGVGLRQHTDLNTYYGNYADIKGYDLSNFLGQKLIDGYVINGSSSKKMTLGSIKEGLIPGTASINRVVKGAADFSFHRLLIYNRELSNSELRQLYEYFKTNNLTYEPPISQLVGFGNSIMQGLSATGNNGFFSRLVTNYNCQAVNYGASGSQLFLNSNNTRSLVTANKNKFNKRSYLLFETGTNDTNIDSTWYGEYLAMIEELIAEGYTANRILLLPPPYHSGAKYTKDQQILTYLNSLSTATGCRVIDILNYTKDNGGDTLMADSVHPNDSGHELISTYIISEL